MIEERFEEIEDTYNLYWDKVFDSTIKGICLEINRQESFPGDEVKEFIKIKLEKSLTEFEKEWGFGGDTLT
jgi:hypothetical protein